MRKAGMWGAALLLCGAALADDHVARGADIGWLTEMEAAGKPFYNAAGARQDVLATLKENGINAVRLRVWVDPPADAGGKVYNDIRDVLDKALRARAAGMKLMIDFHYSDGWADPGQQTKPAAWTAYTQRQLVDAVARHTRDSLAVLRDHGIRPDWVQVGNETNDGMLWGTPEHPAGGRASTSMTDYAELVRSGYGAVKAVFPQAPVIVHVSNCYRRDTFDFIFGGLTAHGAPFDVIGASDYPMTASALDWRQANAACAANLAALARRYKVPVMVSEVGVPWHHADAAAALADLLAKVRAIPGRRGLGVFYWEPQAYDWKGYDMGAWDPDGRPARALGAFRK